MARLLTPQVTAHPLIAETAKELAGAYYEDFARDNLFYKMYPNQRMFIRREAIRFIQLARETLGKLCGTKNISDEQKEDILEALALDSSLPRGRVSKIKPQVMH